MSPFFPSVRIVVRNCSVSCSGKKGSNELINGGLGVSKVINAVNASAVHNCSLHEVHAMCTQRIICVCVGYYRYINFFFYYLYFYTTVFSHMRMRNVPELSVSILTSDSSRNADSIFLAIPRGWRGSRFE